MRQSKFAPVTAGLLVRKGQSAPSPLDAVSYAGAVPPPMPQSVPISYTSARSAVTWLSDVQPRSPREGSNSRYVYTPDEPQALGLGGEGKADTDKPRRIVLTLTPHEYETLGLVAVKKGSTRNLLAQAAMDAYFEWLVAEYGESCNCIVGGALCRCECAH